jgi:hypothetical protein
MALCKPKVFASAFFHLIISSKGCNRQTEKVIHKTFAGEKGGDTKELSTFFCPREGVNHSLENLRSL